MECVELWAVNSVSGPSWSGSLDRRRVILNTHMWFSDIPETVRLSHCIKNNELYINVIKIFA